MTGVAEIAFGATESCDGPVKISHHLQATRRTSGPRTVDEMLAIQHTVVGEAFSVSRHGNDCINIYTGSLWSNVITKIPQTCLEIGIDDVEFELNWTRKLDVLGLEWNWMFWKLKRIGCSGSGIG